MKLETKRALQLATISVLAGWVLSSSIFYWTRLYPIKTTSIALLHYVISISIGLTIYLKYYNTFTKIKSKKKTNLNDLSLK